MGGMGLIFTPVLVRRLLRPSSLVWAYDYIALFGLIATPNSPIGRYNPPPASHPPLHPPHPLIHASVILQWLCKKLLETQQC